ncbi:MAG: class I SAM-dependent methyltransferase [bacterium]|nr:class I SAM-dependent methyltransferase [Candidatus Jorgensenbacteria bacterium]
MNGKKNTSWGGVAEWYSELLGKEGTYQKEVVLPNLLRMMNLQKGETILDLACGEGFFSRAFAEFDVKIIGVDVARNLIDIAKKTPSKRIAYKVSAAHKLEFLDSGSIDKVAIILSVQNMEDIQKVFAECARVLKVGGTMHMVMNHPAFRVPKRSSWGWDEKELAQYRRLDAYMSESTEKIQMHPGDKPSEYTLSFHRPLQVYFKNLKKSGLLVRGLEEWISNRKSEPGPRAGEENRIRKEIPLFLTLEIVKV